MAAESFLRETKLSYVSHSVAGAAAVPAGFAYALLAWTGHDKPLYVMGLLVAGAVMAIAGERLLRLKLRRDDEKQHRDKISEHVRGRVLPT